MQKIDEVLLKQVYALNTSTINCIVWAKDENGFFYLKEFLKQFDIIAIYPFLNAIAIKVLHTDLKKLNDLDAVLYVSSVQKFSILMNKANYILGASALHKKGIVGNNVTVAVIDTGCFAHIDFLLLKNRILVFKDFVNKKDDCYDDNGHGTFVCGVIGGSGIASAKKFCGVAPFCNLVVLKALDKDGQTQATTILDAMQWIFDNKQKYNIAVVCMSFGSEPLKKNDPLIAGAEVLWDNGICVVAASGNDGPEFGTVKSPGASAKIITVGSADKIDNENDAKVAPFSSRGPAFSYVKPDIIAPGVDITSTTNGLNFYTKMSGTSVSTPMVAGVCALLLSEFSFLTPNQIKHILINSAKKLNCKPNECGAGLLNAYNSLFGIWCLLFKTLLIFVFNVFIVSHFFVNEKILLR